MIRRKAGKGKQKNLGSELKRHDHTHSSRIVMGQLCEDKPVLGGALHPRSNVGHERAAGPHPVVEALERTEGAAHRFSCRLSMSSMISSVVPVSPKRGKMRVTLLW